MNHPDKVLERARPALIAGERVFYCRFDSDILFAVSDAVAKDLQQVTFLSIFTDGFMYGMISPEQAAKFLPTTNITPDYFFKDFIEIERDDPAVWE